jgi:hypothetical protein
MNWDMFFLYFSGVGRLAESAQSYQLWPTAVRRQLARLVTVGRHWHDHQLVSAKSNTSERFKVLSRWRRCSGVSYLQLH